MARPSGSQQEKRFLTPFRARGLTLVEIILVLALLVVIGSLSAPMLDGSFSRARLHHGGDLLRAAWSKARLAAMDSGQTHAFRFEMKGSQYRVTSWDSLQMAGAEPAALPAQANDAEDVAAGNAANLDDDRLPEGVVFAAAQIAPTTQLVASPTAVALEGWSPPILFYADGTTSDASVLLSNERELTLRVTLRGLTGVSRPGEIGQEAAP